MISRYLRVFILFGSFSVFGQYSANYTAISNGASIPTTPGVPLDYFGGNPYGTYGTCGAGNWAWTHSLCSDASIDDPTQSIKNNIHSGSTWASGGGVGLVRHMVIDLGQQRSFNELRVFQMMNSDGKVTHVRMYTHPTALVAPSASDTGWNPLFSETFVNNGVLTGISASSPTVITFPGITSRFIMFEARNDGSHGNPNYTEIRELKLFHSSVLLPIEILNFQIAAKEGRWVDLEWQTASEKDNDHFEIHRSVDLKNWEFVTQVEGAGNSTELLNYSTKDLNPYIGFSYYRLTQVDLDGASTSSGTRSVVFNAEYNGDLSIYPNPTSGKLKITGKQHQLQNLQLFNSLGQQISMNILANETHNITIDISNLDSGVYFLRTEEKSYKLVKE